MANKMLIDASHPEETRVVVLRGNRVEEFDFEAASKKQLRGNIYLAKVMRVEPSLQAAFVDYGGNRHGFLAFTEIHPDYYQIPVVDRQALIEEEARAQRDEEDDAPRSQRRSRRYRRSDRNSQRAEKRNGADPTLSEPYADETSGDAEESFSFGDSEEAPREVSERERTAEDVRPSRLRRTRAHLSPRHLSARHFFARQLFPRHRPRRHGATGFGAPGVRGTRGRSLRASASRPRRRSG